VFAVSTINHIELFNGAEFYSLNIQNASELKDLKLIGLGIYNVFCGNGGIMRNFTSNGGNLFNIQVNSGIFEADDNSFVIDNGFEINNISVNNIDYVIKDTIESNYNLIGLTATAQEVQLSFTVTFDGTAGFGTVGAITLPVYTVPPGYICGKTTYNVTTPLVTATSANVVLGYDIDQTDAILDETVANLNSLGIAVINHTTGFTPATDVQSIVGEVTGDDITAGEITIQVTFQKIN
jgi:hypothetical protein